MQQSNIPGNTDLFKEQDAIASPQQGVGQSNGQNLIDGSSWQKWIKDAAFPTQKFELEDGQDPNKLQKLLQDAVDQENQSDASSQISMKPSFSGNVKEDDEEDKQQASTGAEAGRAAGEEVGAQIGKEAGGAAGRAAGDAMLPGVGGEIGEKIGSQIGEKVGKDIGGSMGEQAGGQIDNKVKLSPVQDGGGNITGFSMTGPRPKMKNMSKKLKELMSSADLSQDASLQNRPR